MPLIRSKSKNAFEHNLKAEIEAGKPMKQSLAIAYAMKKKGKKMAYGGESKPKDDVPEPDKQKAAEMQKGALSGGYSFAQSMKNLKEGLGMAHGGEVDEMASGYVKHQGDDVKMAYAAGREDERMLNQHGSEEQGPDGVMMAEGGQIKDNYQPASHEMDMVGRIMKQRQMHYSKGGMVANGGEDEVSHMADGKPNNFDDLALRDDLEFSYTGKNSGDYLSSDQEDHDRKDIVAKIMASRRKKDKMPRPA